MIKFDIRFSDLPYPYNQKIVSLDYKTENCLDHYWLEQHGYEISEMGYDCTYSVKKLPWFRPSSYGDWGTVYDGAGKKGFNIAIRMFEDGLISLWRLETANTTIETEPYTIQDYRDGKKPVVVRERKRHS